MIRMWIVLLIAGFVLWMVAGCSTLASYGIGEPPRLM